MIKTIAKIAMISNEKIAMIKKIKADIDLLSIYSKNVMNVMKRNINDTNVQKLQKKKKKRRKKMQRTHSNLKISKIQNKRAILSSKCLKSFKSRIIVLSLVSCLRLFKTSSE